MRIAFVSAMDLTPWGGSEELWSRTALRLSQLSHDVFALVPYWPQLSPKVSALSRSGITVRVHSRRPPSLMGRALRRITAGAKRDLEQVLKFNPDLVVLSQGSNQDGARWMKYCHSVGVPYVVIVQCNSEHWWIEDKDATDIANAYAAARKICCVSHSNLRLLERQMATEFANGMVVWNPFNVSVGESFCWPEPSNIWQLACVARLHPPSKGQDLLFQVLADNKWRQRPMVLNLYGGGPFELNLRRLAQYYQLQNVKFCGHVQDVQGIWKRNHLLVLPSRYEGLPLALVEAMWCGRPSVVTDVGGNAEVCVDGETGFVAAAPTAGHLADALQRAWDRRHEWEAMGRRALEHAERLIPKDPVDEFCRLLLERAAAKTQDCWQPMASSQTATAGIHDA